MKTISKDTLCEVLGKNISRYIDREDYEVRSVSPIQLLTANRFDVIAKYLYVKNFANMRHSNRWKDLYLEHIKIFNGYLENDGSGKIGPGSFIDSFNSLIGSVQGSGLTDGTIIPRGRDGDVLDGAHRLACALSFGLQMDVVEIGFSSAAFSFNQDYFKKGGMPETYLDEMALEYAKLKPNHTFMVSVWPRVAGKEENLRAILRRYGSIVYHKEVKLSFNGMVNLMRHAYRDESWLGDYRNEFEGACNKARFCFREGYPLRVYLMESTASMIQMKEEIRELYSVEKHAVHINDTGDETVELAELLFNKNSIHFLNVGQRKYFNTFHGLFKEYKKWLLGNSQDRERFCLMGGGLSAYGVRESKDIDYLTTQEDMPAVPNRRIELETEKQQYVSASVVDLVHNPQNYFYSDGVKFSSLDIIYEVRSKRRRDSDILEIEIVKALISSSSCANVSSIRIKRFLKVSFYKRLIKFILLTGRFYFYHLLKKGVSLFKKPSID